MMGRKNYGLGRNVRIDHRDAKFLLRDVTPDVPRPERKVWRCDAHLDQGQTSQCVGYSWTHFLRAAPRRLRALDPVFIYHGAQINDEWVGEDYEGSSVRGGAKFLAESAKIITEYRWAFSTDELLDFVGLRGPAVIGINWYSQMFTPNAEGIIKIGGGIAGGHAIMVRGYNDKRGLLLLHNSWGREWGNDSCAMISYEDVERLLREEGEACSAVEK